VGPEALSGLLSNLPSVEDKNLIVGFEKSDDAAVYKVSEDLALIQTLDFFMPMVEDPYIFGQVAAANSLSDVYAMGGEPKTAMNIVCFPEKLDIDILGEILRGGAEKIAEAGAVLSGGHTVHDDGIKYGLSVTGFVHPEKVMKNHGSREGDVLILTKPIGTGIISTAYKVGEASQRAIDEMIVNMTTLNKYSMDIIKKYPVTACTDITGFGFLGHAYEMADASGVTYDLHRDFIPYIKEAKEYAQEFYITGGGQKNRVFAEKYVDMGDTPFWMQEVMFDPQTSGGLLFSIEEKYAGELLEELNELEIKSAIVGMVERRGEKIINVG